MRRKQNRKLSKKEINKIEDIVADRLANILIMQLDHEKMNKMENKKIEELAQLFAKHKTYSHKCYGSHSPVEIFQRMFPDDPYGRDLKTFLACQNYVPERRGADLPWWGRKYFTDQGGFRVLVVSQDSLAKEAGSIVLWTHLMPVINSESEYKKLADQLNTQKPFSFRNWSKIKNQLIEWDMDFNFLYITDAMKVYKKGSWEDRDFDKEKSKKLLGDEIEFCNPNLIILLGASPLHLLMEDKSYASLADSGNPFLVNGRKYIVAPFLIGNGRTQPNFEKRLGIATNLIKLENRKK